MPAGKLAAQAGHAYTDSLMDCMDKRPDLFDRYRRGGNAGSKACLKAKNEAALRRLADECAAAGVPHAVVVDSNHVLLPHFDGSPVMTAVGVGPVSRAQARGLVKRFQCV
jgi:PTH2 family peptidyl-tRNA hydrolase